MCLLFSDWPISIHNWVNVFHRVLSDPYSDVLCSKECQTKKLLVCCKMFAFFKANFKYILIDKYSKCSFSLGKPYFILIGTRVCAPVLSLNICAIFNDTGQSIDS